jgi:hypothetical protein
VIEAIIDYIQKCDFKVSVRPDMLIIYKEVGNLKCEWRWYKPDEMAKYAYFPMDMLESEANSYMVQIDKAIAKQKADMGS